MSEPYFCMICGKNHIRGNIFKQHREHARKETMGSPSPGDSRINEMLLFSYIAQKNDPTYSSILRFLSSFGIKTVDALLVIIKKLKDGDIAYTRFADANYQRMLELLIFSPRFAYPLTLTFQEAFEMFGDLGIRYANEFIEFLTRVARENPEFMILSSSKIGEPPNIITFKQIFKDEIIFKLNNNWVL